MLCSDGAVNTGELPHTYSTLSRLLPSVLKTKCFNDHNYPFTTEVKKTEIGHLFEHLMLDYICQYKLAMGDKKVSVAGVTDWNWRRDPYGTFHITLEVGRAESTAFNEAFKNSIRIFEVLFNEKQTV